MEEPLGGTVRIFEPSDELLQETGLMIEEGLVEPAKDHLITLVVQNQNPSTVHLREEQVLGDLQVATVLQDEGGSEVLVGKGCSNLDVDSGAERTEILWETLHPGTSRLSAGEVAQLKELIAEYADVFALDASEQGSTDVVQHGINTGNHLPIRQAPRRTPFTLRKKVEEMVNDMLEKEVIQPSQSPWASPVVLVTKKDGSARFCVDYRKLNAVTKLDVFPLPRIDDSLDSLAHTRYFTTLDLAAGYWQVPMEAHSREKTTFLTHSGLYEFRVMPFGLCNAPATFQRLMETVLAGLARDSCMVYLDDILVIGKSFGEHLRNLKKVFSRLRDTGLRLKPKKCHLALHSVEYLGYVVTDQGIAADPKKVEAIQQFPAPGDLKALRSFVGLASYYRRFIPSFSKIAA